MDTYPIIKYIFLFILYIFSFICVYSPQIEIAGFVSIFVIQIIYTICLLFDIFSDKTRNTKVLTMPSNSTLKSNELSFPLYWFILPVAGLQFREMITLIIMINQSYKKYGNIKISRDNRGRLEQFKLLFLISIVLLFIITILYINYKNIEFTGSMQLLIFILISVLYIVEVINNLNVTNITYQMQNTTDG
jgi:hypothetical protein